MTKSTAKGNIVEEIAARLHQAPDIKLERKARLRPRSGKGKTREIDILLTGKVARYPVKIAIECKNEAKPIGAPYIEGFKGKLDLLGIPHQHGVFISASSYTNDAKVAASEFGITLLQLTGLTDDGLNSAVSKAFQSIIYLLPIVEAISVETILPNTVKPIFFDDEEKFCGTVFDLVWRMWRDSKLSTDLGEQDLILDVPSNWHQFDEGKKIDKKILPWRAKVSVVALVITHQGQTKQHALINVEDQSVEKLQVDIDFDQSNNSTSVIAIHQECDLIDLLKANGGTKIVTGRIKLPRIRGGGRFGYIYWPPSKEAIGKLAEWASKYGLDDIVNPDMIDPFNIEGTDMARFWDEPWEDYPGLRE